MNYRVILLLSVLSFCFLSAAADSPFSGSFTLDRASPGNSNHGTLTDALVSGSQSTLNIVNKYDTLNSPSNPGPFCYLEVAPLSGSQSTDYWTKPCPRTPQLQFSPESFWCMCNFTSDGNIVLTSGDSTTSGNIATPYENGKVMWSSNTGGMGVQSIGLFESSDPAGMGNTLVLYNANQEIVWGNIANNPASEDYNCTDATAQSPVGAPTPSAARKLLQH